MTIQLDHLVLPVETVGQARKRYDQLGFTVAPDGIHPFGTINCCVFFKDRTFLEPLAVHDEEQVRAAVAANHSFVRNDQVHRLRRPQSGFSTLVVRGHDEISEPSSLFYGGPDVHFERAFHNDQGASQRVAFDLTFHADPRSPDAYFFNCKSLLPLQIDIDHLRSHANGVTGIAEIVSTEPNGADLQDFMSHISQEAVEIDGKGVRTKLGSAIWSVLNSKQFSQRFGGDNGHCAKARGLRHQAIVFKVESSSELERLLISNKVEHTKIGSLLVVPPAEGQQFLCAFQDV